MRDNNREKKIYQPGRYGDSEQKTIDGMFSNFLKVESKKTPEMPPPPLPSVDGGTVVTNEGELVADWNG